MYLPSDVVLNKTLNLMFEMAMRDLQKNGQLTGLESIYLEQQMVNGKLDLSWLGDMPRVREWIGSKVYGDLKEFAYQLAAKPFYDGLSIKKEAIRRSDLSGVQPRINQLVTNLSVYKAELILDALVNGTTGLAYDGQAFFANRAVNDNLAAGSGVTVANLMTDLATGRRTVLRFKSDKGRFMRVLPDTVICPTELEPAFLTIKNSTDNPTTNNRSANPYSGMIKEVIALPDLDDANDWYYIASGYTVKPFVFGYELLENNQQVVPVLDTTKVASDGVYGYSAEMSGKAGYGLYEMAIKFVNA